MRIRYLSSPVTSGLTDVVFTGFDEADNQIIQQTMTEMGTSGIYYLDVTSPSVTWGIVESQTINSKDIVRLSPNIHDIATSLNFLKEFESGAWKIIGHQMIFYDHANNVIATYNLLDDAGNPATPATATQRIPV